MNKKLKVIGVALTCLDCECYIDPKSKVVFKCIRRNPDYKKGQPKHNAFINLYNCGCCGDKYGLVRDWKYPEISTYLFGILRDWEMEGIV